MFNWSEAVSNTCPATGILLSATVLLGLAACGGGGSSSSSTGLTAATNPTPNLLRGTGQAVNTLQGSAVRIVGQFSSTIVNTTGTLNRNTGSLQINDGLINFSDTNGPNSQGVFRDGGDALTISGVGFQDFDFVFPYVQISTFAGFEVGYLGVAGSVTPVANVPTAHQVLACTV